MQTLPERTIAENEDNYHDDESASDYHDAVFANRGCCNWLPCLRKWDRIDSERNDCAKGSWNCDVLMKVKVWSKIAAGPKLNRFIRRMRMNRFRNGRRRFKYDALSYSMNFDESAIENQRSSSCDEDLLRRGFSMRYASMNSGSGKMLMDVASR